MKQKRAEWIFVCRRAEQLYEEGETAAAAKLLRCVDDAQARLFAAELKKEGRDGADGRVVSTPSR